MIADQEALCETMKINPGYFRMVQNQKGVTLLEVLIALTIFTIGIMGVAGMHGVSMKSVGSAHRQTRQSMSAANAIEAILTKPYDHPLLRDGDSGYEPGSPDHGPYTVDGCPATIEWEVQDDFPVKGTKRITVMIRPAAIGGHVLRSPTVLRYVRASETPSMPQGAQR